MDKIVLYTKTYSGDIERVKNLIESVKKYNKDNITHYISFPKNELPLFNKFIGTDYVKFIFDEDISDITLQNWYTQQIIKSSFWKLGVCENYVMIDSDSYFIKDFYISDFMYNENIPYTVIHEQKDLFTFSSNYEKSIGHDPQIAFIKERENIMRMFKREGRVYDFGPGPVIWNCNVWKTLDETQLKPQGLTFVDLINIVPSEFTWYGEFLLKTLPMIIIPIEPMFKFFHFQSQYEFYKKLEYTEETFSKNYLGLVMQSNWGAPLKY